MNFKQSIQKRDPIVLLAVPLYGMFVFLGPLILTIALIAVFCVGIVVLIRGKFIGSTGKKISKREARICGWIYVLSMPICIALSSILVAYLLNKGCSAADFVSNYEWLLVLIQSTILISTLVVANVLANRFYSKITKPNDFPRDG